MSGYVALPVDLESMPPGPELGAVLASLDPSLYNGFQLVEILAAQLRYKHPGIPHIVDHDTYRLIIAAQNTQFEVGPYPVAVAVYILNPYPRRADIAGKHAFQVGKQP